MPKSILIVDDEIVLLEMLSSLLEAKGFVVLKASTVIDAESLFTQNQPDIVLSDLRMPDGGGERVLEFIRARSQAIPVILMTGYSDLTVQEAMDRGADAFLAKPFPVEELLSVIDRALLPLDERWKDNNPVKIRLDAEINCQRKATDSINIARGGMFVALDGSLPRLLDQVCFKFNFDLDDVPPLEGIGLVRWVRQNPLPGLPRGVGIEFLSLPVATRKRLLSMIYVREAKAFIPNSIAKHKTAS